MKNLLFMVLTIFTLVSCNNENVTAIKVINSKSIAQSDFSVYKKLDTLTFHELITHEEVTGWNYHKALLSRNYPKRYWQENEPYEKSKYEKEFKSTHNFYLYSITVNQEEHKFILVTSKSNFNEWEEKGFDLKLFYMNKLKNNVKPIQVATYMHFMPVVEYEKSTAMFFYSDGKFITKSVSSTCSDVIFNGKTTCRADTIKVEAKFTKETLRVIDRDTIHYEYKI